MDLVGFIYGFGALQGFTLCAILLWNSSGNRNANMLMAALIAVISLHLVNIWLVRAGVYINHYPQWAGLIPPMRFTWGPRLYLYARTVVNKPASIPQIVHFIPYLLLAGIGVVFIFYPAEKQIVLLNLAEHLQNELQEPVQYEGIGARFLIFWFGHHLQGSLFIVQFGIYCFAVLRLLRQHSRNLKQYYSSLERLNLRWLRTMTWLCLLFSLLFLLFNRSRLLLADYVDMSTLLPNTPYLLLVIGIYFIGFMALTQPKLVPEARLAPVSPETDTKSENKQASIPRPETDEADHDEKPQSEKYQRSTLTEEDATTYAAQLQQVMDEQELYLDCDLTMPQLADNAGIAPYLVSQVLNGPMHQSFFEFVNSYRIKLAKDLMTDPSARKLAIVDLAVEVGFKSKSSFYDAFKKVTQMNPTQFKKSLSV
jgi:AraC-like DNA-binding protein